MEAVDRSHSAFAEFLGDAVVEEGGTGGDQGTGSLSRGGVFPSVLGERRLRAVEEIVGKRPLGEQRRAYGHDGKGDDGSAG